MTALAEIDNMISEPKNKDAEETNNKMVKTNNNDFIEQEETQDPTFCGVDMDDMALPCGMGGAVASATLPRELISRLSLLPESSASSSAAADSKNLNSTDLVSSLYSDNLTYLCGPGKLSEDENDPIPASVLSDPSRSICVVTTASLPWRTGTAVNPLLRALYLVRYQREHEGNTAEDSKGSVALVIPWLESSEERAKLYGTANKFLDGPRGMKEQEQWIKKYAKERCDMENEANELKYIWYPAFYVASFGSIFPKVDLCNYIPSELVDVAILEEPEHLNWFRMPNKEPSSSCVSAAASSDADDDEQEGGKEKNVAEKDEVEKFYAEDEQGGDVKGEKVLLDNAAISGEVSVTPIQNQTGENAQQFYKLGWTHRFLFVVGIVHTNYEEYARQYGVGASLIAAPAIGALSALTMRAYCHQVIKLSNTLPSFAPGKECTCNVHGVRREFLEDGSAAGTVEGDSSDSETSPVSVYFIGKLVWAKVSQLLLLTFSHKRVMPRILHNSITIYFLFRDLTS